MSVNDLIRGVNLQLTAGERLGLYKRDFVIDNKPKIKCDGPYQLASFDEYMAMCDLATHSSHWFSLVEKLIKPDTTLHKIDENYYNYCLNHSLYPGVIGYENFPKACCVSLNSVIAHGLPFGSSKIKSGDLVKVDVVFCDANHNFIDIANTFACAPVSVKSHDLIKQTRHALTEAIDACKSNDPISLPSFIFEKIASENGFRVVKNLHSHFVRRGCVHAGIIPNTGDFYRRSSSIPKFKEAFSLEPMFTLDKDAKPILCQAGTAFKTKHDEMATHFERTCVMTPMGARSLHIDL